MITFKKAIFQTTVVRGFVLILNILSGIILARNLTPGNLGVFNLILLISTFSFRFLNLGVGSGIAYYFPRKEISITEGLKIILIYSVVFSLVGTIIFYTINRFAFSPWYDIESILFIIGLLFLPFFFFSNFANRLLTGLHEITLSNLNETTQIVLKVIIFLILYLNGNFTVLAATVCVLGIQIIVSSLQYFQIIQKRNLAKVNRTESSFKDLSKKIFSFSLWNYAQMALNFISLNAPILLIKVITKENSEVGYYSVANSIANKLLFIATPISEMLFPYNAAISSEKAINRTLFITRAIFILFLPIVIFLLIFADNLIIFLYGVAYEKASSIFLILNISIIFWLWNRFLMINLASIGNAREVALINMTAFSISLPFFIYLVFLYSSIGGAMGFGIYVVLTNLILLFYYRRCFDVQIIDIIIPKKEDFPRLFNAIKSLSREKK